MVAEQKPDIAQVWRWLASVPDPEIPVLSVVDLGIVRHLAWVNDTLEVVLTPTYSGCPATRVIAMDVETALRGHGITKLALKEQLSPAWTTDWLTSSGREKLETYGIAPPQASGKPDKCPRCGAKNVERVSQFGSTPCKAHWRCQACLEPFDYFKCM